MYNVKAAVSRLAFAPKPKEMEVTDIATGHFVFRPVAGEEASFAALEEAIEDAGYEIEEAAIAVTGTLTDQRHLRTPVGQLFHLAAESDEAKRALAALPPGRAVTVSGRWRTAEGVEVVSVAEIEGEGAGGT